jgi:FixJ family two-component response regulator
MIDDPLNRTKVRRGSDLTHAKLTEEDVQLVLQLVAYREGLRRQLRHLTNKAIAEKFGVHQRTVDRVISGENWGHVGGVA